MSEFKNKREEMVERQLVSRGITDERVLDAMLTVPREKFVPASMTGRAYDDSALPIGSDQTISQPYVVALTIEALNPGPEYVILDIGTGSGYAAAVAGKIVKEVYTIERIESLANFAKKNLEQAGCDNVHLKHGDGTKGWPEHAPYDGIMAAAASSDIPDALKDQLATEGHLVMPVGKGLLGQTLRRYTKKEDGKFKKENLIPVRFVPLLSGKD
ncbi:MAG TPA: protein-L-isoaspartate(D-aspartate) O-methyltransferase [Balneolaceae bacterium]|nr:protein-L-isoaspartate(D-aspartate) O-methyltransferase [Balneolaceae bacterium]